MVKRWSPVSFHQITQFLPLKVTVNLTAKFAAKTTSVYSSKFTVKIAVIFTCVRFDSTYNW